MGVHVRKCVVPGGGPELKGEPSKRSKDCFYADDLKYCPCSWPRVDSHNTGQFAIIAGLGLSQTQSGKEKEARKEERAVIPSHCLLVAVVKWNCQSGQRYGRLPSKLGQTLGTPYSTLGASLAYYCTRSHMLADMCQIKGFRRPRPKQRGLSQTTHVLDSEARLEVPSTA
jgi:hypothetical protein